jgi:hypothetical protein
VASCCLRVAFSASSSAIRDCSLLMVGFAADGLFSLSARAAQLFALRLWAVLAAARVLCWALSEAMVYMVAF